MATKVSTGQIDIIDVYDGAEGKSAITAILSNETHAFPADVNGNVTSYIGSGTEIRVYEGATAIVYDGVGTTNSTWKATSAVSNIICGSFTDSGNYLTVGNHSGVASAIDTASITYTLTGTTSNGDVFTIVKTQTFSKAKAGATGADGTNGTNGSSIRKIFSRIANNPTPTSGTITVSGDNLPTQTQSNTTWALNVVWSTTDPSPSSTNTLYTSDGIFTPATNQTVWTTPYISSLKVGTLSAITTNTGSLSVTGTIQGNTAAISGTTMTGQGIQMTSGGGVCIGNATANICIPDGGQLYLNGAVVASGNIAANAITAEKINASAITVDKINNDAVVTAKILDEAVTKSVSVYTDGEISSNSIGETVIQSLSITTTGKPVRVDFGCYTYSSINQSLNVSEIRIYRDSTLLTSFDVRPFSWEAQYWFILNGQITDTPPSGTNSYYIKQYFGPGGLRYAKKRYLSAIENKK